MQSHWLQQWFFLCVVNELDFRFIGALGNVLKFPPHIFRSGVLRQGSDKFYSVSFQARHRFFATVESCSLA